MAANEQLQEQREVVMCILCNRQITEPIWVGDERGSWHLVCDAIANEPCPPKP